MHEGGSNRLPIKPGGEEINTEASGVATVICKKSDIHSFPSIV
jgi:hypothetical protein